MPGRYEIQRYLAYTDSGTTRHIVECRYTERYLWHRAACGRQAKMARIAPWHPSVKGVCRQCLKAISVDTTPPGVGPTQAPLTDAEKSV